MSRTILVERRRTLLRASGRDPARMLDGLATAALAEPPPDRAVYTAFLTPKGRMVADARVLLLKEGAAPERELLIEADPAAGPGLTEHLKKFVPPLFAKFEDVTGSWRVLGVYGPGARGAAAAGARALGGSSAAADLERAGGAGAEGILVRIGGDPPAFAVRSDETGSEGWDLLVPAAGAGAVEAAILEAGAGVDSPEAVDRLRVLAGRPRWGAELSEDVIPLEAGLLERAISQTKGCYTGQEVIVRILHRGHVNRHLRRLRFAGDPPAPGTELYEPGGAKARGHVTSAVATPGGGVGLGYVRREVEPPAELRLGAPDGHPVTVEVLPGSD